MPGDHLSQQDHILTELKKTGLPLEVEVADLLEKEWLVFSNQLYVDEDEGKTREIDIFAIHQNETDQLAFTKRPRMFIGLDLAIECKKSETHAWVFLSRKKSLPPGLGSGQTLDFLQVFTNRQTSFLSGQFVDLPKLHFDKEKRVAHTGVSIKRQGSRSRKERDEIFEARNQLMKYSFDLMKGWRQRILSDVTRRDVAFLFLTIVFDGPLYEAWIENGELKLQPTNHILLSSGRYSTTQQSYDSYLIDVVTKQRVPDHLRLVSQDIALLTQLFTWDQQVLVAKADALMKSLGFKGSTPTNAEEASRTSPV